MSHATSCTHSEHALKLDPNATVHRGINWDWVNFTSQQAADDFYYYMGYNYGGVVRHHGLEIRWG